MQDGFVECPRCNSQLCYAQRIDDQETWICMHCGMTSTTLMKQGTDTEKAVSARQPELYRDLSFVDKDGYVWYPAVITVPGKGMVFLDGTSVKDARWTGIPIRQLSRREMRMKKYEGKNSILDTNKRRQFDSFVDALAAMGMLGDED